MATGAIPDAAARPERWRQLDALRALVVLGLIFFHAALVFDSNDDYYVKNAQTTGVTTILAGFAVIWAMPMLFLVAGFGSWHSLRRRGPGGFAAERLLRLGLPLVFATLTIIPVPPWLRLRAADPNYHESYLHFLPRFFAVHLQPGDFPFVLQGRYFETGHLWFVVLLLTFSLILAAVVRRLPDRGRRAIRERLAAGAGRRGWILLPALPVALVSAVLGLEKDFAAWNRWAYLLFFLYGFALAADGRLRAAVHRDPGPVTVLALVLSLGGLLGFLVAGRPDGSDPFTDMTPLAIAARTLYGAAGWCLLLVILRLLDRRRPSPEPAPPQARPRRFAVYLAPAVLPLYVLHQPIVVAVAYGVVGWHAPILVKYCAVVSFSLLLAFAAYDLLVRRTRAGRFLFGMRTAPAATARAGSGHDDR